MVQTDRGTAIHPRYQIVVRLASGVLLYVALVWPALADSLVSTSFEPDPQLPLLSEYPPGWEFRAVDGAPEVSGRWDVGTAREGERSLVISGPGPRGAFLGPRCAVSGGDWVRSSVWVRSWRLDGAAYLGILWFDGEGRVIDEVRSGPGTGAERWRRCALEAPAPPATVTLRPFLALEGAGMVWFDELRVIRRSKPPVTLADLTAPKAQQGGRCPITLSIDVREPIRMPSLVALELICITDGAVGAQGEFETALGGEDHLAPGSYAMGPFDLEIDPYATPGPYFVRARLGTMTLDSFGLEDGTVTVGMRSRRPVEGRRARLSVATSAPLVAGETVEVGVSMTVWPPISHPTFVAVGLEQDGALYAAAELLLRVDSQSDSSSDLSATGVLGLPADLASGTYLLTASATGQMLDCPTATRAVQVTGSGPGARPLSWGRYESAEGTSHFWRTTESGAMIWDGFPFMPTGVMVRTRYLDEYSRLDPKGNGERWREFAARTRALADAGIEDVYLVTGLRGLAGVPTEAMQRVVDRFEELGLRYGIEIGGTLGDGYEGYLLGTAWQLNECIPGRENAIALPPNQFMYGSSALVAIYDEATGELVGAQHARLEGNSVSLRIESTPETEGHSYSLHVTPLVRVPPGAGAGDVSNEGAFRGRKLAVCQAIEALRFGDGLRFLTNPLSGDPGLPPANVIPAFPSTFSLNLAQWLKTAYGGSVELLRHHWGVPGIPSFEVAGWLVPASGPEAVPLVDSRTGLAFPFDAAGSAYWADLECFRQDVQASALEDMVESVKSVVDVPVLIEPAAGELESVVADDGPTAVLRATRGSGLHNISLSPRFGHDGVAIAAPALPNDLTAAVHAVRLAENRQQARYPWLVATRIRPTADDLVRGNTIAETLAQVLHWGAAGFYVRWGSDEVGDRAAPDLVDYPHLLGTIAQARDWVWSQPGTDVPELLYAYPPRLRNLTPDALDQRPMALDGAIGSAPAVALAGGRWLVPGSVYDPGPDRVYVVSLPEARRRPEAARQLEKWATLWPDAEVWLLGPRRDLGEIPALDACYSSVWAPCEFGSGQYQRLANEPDLLPAPPGVPGHPVLTLRGQVRLFPVEGLGNETVLWVLGGTTPSPREVERSDPPLVDDWRIKVELD